MIRASNQLSPKSKVVDLLSLYNFYFGQISCSNVKFGVLGGQTLIKIISNEFHSVTVFSSEVVRTPIPRPRVVAGDATRRPSAILACRARTPSLSPLPESCPFSPPFLLHRAARSRAAEPRRRPPLRPSIATVPRFLASQAAPPRPPPSSLHLVLD